jgi:hypothetical protein
MQNRGRQRCTACGAEAPASSRFCGQCGKPLAAPEEELPQPEGSPVPGEAPIFLHTSSRSYQVKGETFTPPKAPPTRPLPLGWLEESLLSERVPGSTSRPRPFPFPAEEQGSEQGSPPEASAPAPTSPTPPLSNTPLPPPLPTPLPVAANGLSTEVPAWLSSVVAGMEEEQQQQQQAQEDPRSWKKRTLLISLISVGVAVVALTVFLLSTHRL